MAKKVKVVDRTLRSHMKCENCAFYNEEKMGILYVKNNTELHPICEIFDMPKRFWGRCKFFQWRE